MCDNSYEIAVVAIINSARTIVTVMNATPLTPLLLLTAAVGHAVGEVYARYGGLIRE